MRDLDIKIVRNTKAPAKRPKSVGVKTVITDSGEKARVLTVDANSESFGSDLLYVFKQNVRHARQENKAKLGSARGLTKRG
jgi:hypothetical protein